MKCTVQHWAIETGEKTALDCQYLIRGLGEVTYCSSIQLDKAMGFLRKAEELRVSLKVVCAFYSFIQRESQLLFIHAELIQYYNAAQ